jgi:hypothetical protein
MDQTQTPPQPELSKFTVDAMFNEYLKTVKLDARKMVPHQLRETRRAFYGAVTQLIILQRDELTKLTEEQGMQVLYNLLQESHNFWLKETR